ncbi:MAG TPA: o-succinylbenzoate synthase, partial [Chryseobacterium indologenes]|nr:o-succinylbenzoate synthase [Chryseobacterium indologenes]
MKASYKRYLLEFKRPSGTSRGVLLDKETFILEISENGKTGIGECAVFRGLSFDDMPDYEG